MSEQLIGELEFAARAYEVATEHLLAAMSKAEDIPPRIIAALDQLASAINDEWKDA